jgi:two-component sensor histidine kinase
MTPSTPPTYQFSIDVPVENRWDNVERVRSAVQYCFEAVFRDIAGRDAIAMVTGELVENAIKYGDWSAGRGIFRLRVWGDHERAAVAVTNAVSASSGGVAKVKEVIDFIVAQPTPLHAYQARLVAVAGNGGSGLGLVRVAYEGGCSLTMSADGDEMTVTAERRHPSVGKSIATPARA